MPEVGDRIKVIGEVIELHVVAVADSGVYVSSSPYIGKVVHFCTKDSKGKWIKRYG